MRSRRWHLGLAVAAGLAIVAIALAQQVPSTQPAAGPATQPARGGAFGAGGAGRGGGRRGNASQPQTTVEQLATMPAVTPEIVQQVQNQISVPEGFEWNVFATPPSVNYPTALAATPDGVLFVGVDGNGAQGQVPGLGRILRVRDTKGTGKADEVKAFVPKCDSVRGMIWNHDHLIVMHNPYISAYYDHNGDGIADEEKILIRGVGNPISVSRVDHGQEQLIAGIDGWIYLSCGDMGFREAIGTDGRKVQLHGGGVARFRPDGTQLEIWVHGTRNVYGFALSPALEAIARDNTNDGGGWNVRMHHYTGFEEHGYPSLFVNFPGEFIEPLVDLGNGSGTGGMWLDEPGIPQGWNDEPYTSDYGRAGIFRQTVTPKGATYTISNDPFIRMPNSMNLEVDGNTVMYASSWRNGGFSWGGPMAGLVIRVVPKGYKADPLPDFDKATNAELVKLLESPSARRRLEAQRVLLRRADNRAEITPMLEALASDKTKRLYYRVAALFTLKLANGAASHATIARLVEDPTIAALAIRALGDDLEQAKTMPIAPVAAALKSPDPRTRKEAMVALWRANAQEQVQNIIAMLNDPDPVIYHTAMQSLLRMHNLAAMFGVLDYPNATAAQRAGVLLALKQLHESEVVDGLIQRLDRETDADKRFGIIGALCRLSNREADWDGTWWGTHPDTSGPYFSPVAWSESPKILASLIAALDKADAKDAVRLAREFQIEKVQAGKAAAKLIAAANLDPTLVPMVVAGFAEADEIPANAIPFLAKVATDISTNLGACAQAVIALVKTDDDAAWNAVLPGLQRLQNVPFGLGNGGRRNRGGGAAGQGAAAGPGGAPAGAGGAGARQGGAPGANARGAGQAAAPARGPRGGGRGGAGGASLIQQARNAVSNSPNLENHFSLFVDQAAKTDGPLSQVADTILLNLAARPIGMPKAHQAAVAAIDEGWKNPKRKIQIMQAAVAIRDTSRAAQIVDATSDPNPQVAQAATSAIQSLGIDAEKMRAEAKLPRIGTMKTTDVLDAIMSTKGDIPRGAQLFTQLGCVACHTVNAGDPPKGPFLGTISTIYKRRDLAENILLPNKTIAQGFHTVAFGLKNGDVIEGFIVREAADVVTIRNATGDEFKLPVAQINRRVPRETSMMPEGLLANTTINDFASLLDYLESPVK